MPITHSQSKLSQSKLLGISCLSCYFSLSGKNSVNWTLVVKTNFGMRPLQQVSANPNEDVYSGRGGCWLLTLGGICQLWERIMSTKKGCRLGKDDVKPGRGLCQLRKRCQLWERRMSTWKGCCFLLILGDDVNSVLGADGSSVDQQCNGLIAITMVSLVCVFQLMVWNGAMVKLWVWHEIAYAESPEMLTSGCQGYSIFNLTEVGTLLRHLSMPATLG